MSQPSVTTWLGFLKAGDVAAAESLWRRYYTDLVEQARQHLSKQVRRAADEEDVALSLAAGCVLLVLALLLYEKQRRQQLTSLPLNESTQPSPNQGNGQAAEKIQSVNLNVLHFTNIGGQFDQPRDLLGKDSLLLAGLIARLLLPGGNALGQDDAKQKRLADKPQWQRYLQGDDASKTAGQEDKLAQLQQAGDFEAALKVAQAQAQLRSTVQGADHWQAIEARRMVEVSQGLLRDGKERQQSLCCARP